MVAFTVTNSHMSPSKYTQFFTKNPNLRTVAVMQLALPMRQINTEKRLAECSFVSVFTMVDGKVKPTIHKETLSTPGSAIKLWFSDLVEQDELKGLPHKCIRPLYKEYVFPFHPKRSLDSYVLLLLGTITVLATLPSHMPHLTSPEILRRS
jgi:hypothetical protein